MKRGQDEPVVGDNEESRKKAKTDPTLLEKVKKQVEFYFGDSNYPRDKFMKETAEKNEGWIPMATLFLFKRLQSLTTDPETVYDACKDSTIVVFDDAKSKVRRAAEVPAETSDTYKQRSVDVFPLPEGVTIESVEAFFATYGKVLSVRLRKRGGKFSHAARVEFSTEEEAKKASEAVDAQWTSGDKLKIIRVGSEKPKDTKKGSNKKGQREEFVPTFTAGTIVRITNLPVGSNQIELKQCFSKFGKVAYVDTRDEKSTLVRFHEPVGAQEMLKEVEAKTVKVGETVIEGDLLPVKEDEEYWNTKVLPGIQNKAKTGGRRDRR